MSCENEFTKDTLDLYFKELAKAFRKLNGTKMPAELIIVGGASILINYDFRNSTVDIDAIIQASSSMKDAIRTVRDKMNLPDDWLNADFIRTSSYSPKLIQYSKYYKTFSNVLSIRTVAAEYLVAMKLMSDRDYKNDYSDIVGIIWEQKEKGKEIVLEDIKRAVIELYGNYDVLPVSAKEFIEEVYSSNDLQKMFKEICKEENENREILLSFQEEYPNVLNENNVKEIVRRQRTEQR